MATAPPLRPVPAPRGTRGTPWSWGEPDDARYFLGGGGEHDGLGEPAVDGAVELEDQHVLGGVEDVFVAHDPLEDVDQGLVGARLVGMGSW